MRTWIRRIRLALLVMAGLCVLGLLAVNLFLNTPASTWAFNRRPERFQIGWSAAWSVWPGFVHVRGLQLSGKTRNVAWSIAAERAAGRIPLAPLFDRTLVVTDLHAESVRSSVLRGVDVGSPPSQHATHGQERRPPWTFRFTGVTLDHIREFRFNAFRLTGDGEAAGSFWFVLGGDFRLEPSRVRMPAGQLAWGDDTFGRAVALKVEASLGPYSPRQHPGLAGFNFLSGSLQARGEVPELPFLESAGIPGTRAGPPGALVADVRVKQGRFLAGSRFDVSAPGSAPPFALHARTEGNQLIRLGMAATGLAMGRRPNGPPLFRSASLNLSSTTAETRLSRVFATARDLRTKTVPTTLRLIGDVQAERVQIEAPGSIGTLHATLDRAAGRVDLAGLLRRDFDVEGLQAEGVSARLDLAANPAPARSPISIRLADARLTGIREIAIADLVLAGEARAEATFSYGRDGTLSVERAVVALPSGRLLVKGEPAAQGLSLQAEVRIEPAILGKTFLRHVSGTAAFRGQVSSLGFLRAFLQRTPWLALQGQGGLTADVRLDHGRLEPGTRLTLIAAPARATILDSLATGRGTMTAAVEGGKSGPRTTLGVRFDRFGLADPRQPGRPAYILGQGLTINAVARGALDLTAPAPDFDVVFDLPEAEVPDLAVYNALIPEATGLSLLSGRGRARMHLTASTATHKAQGVAVLSSDAAKIQFQNLELLGRLTLRAPLVSPDLERRRFDLKGVRLELDNVSYQDVSAEAPAEPPGWWARAQLDSGSLVWGNPLSLRGRGRIDMKSSGPLLTLFTPRSRFLKWFDDVLNVENVTAEGVVRLGNGAVQIESLQATGGPLELRTRMTFSKTRKLGDLYVRYGRLAAGIELRDGQRNLRLRHALEWYESGQGAWTSR